VKNLELKFSTWLPKLLSLLSTAEQSVFLSYLYSLQFSILVKQCPAKATWMEFLNKTTFLEPLSSLHLMFRACFIAAIQSYCAATYEQQNKFGDKSSVLRKVIATANTKAVRLRS